MFSKGMRSEGCTGAPEPASAARSIATRSTFSPANSRGLSCPCIRFSSWGIVSVSSAGGAFKAARRTVPAGRVIPAGEECCRRAII